MPAISTARRSVVDPDFGDEYLEYGHRVIETAAAIGAAIVSFGFFRALTPAQRDALWFWTVQGPIDSDDPADWKRAVRRTRELGKHAAEVGIAISLEMYEDTYLGMQTVQCGSYATWTIQRSASIPTWVTCSAYTDWSSVGK